MIHLKQGILRENQRQFSQWMNKVICLYLSIKKEVISAGKPVAMAGEIDVKDGVLKHFSNRSGHYRPTTQHLNQGIDHLKAQGLNFESAKVIDEF